MTNLLRCPLCHTALQAQEKSLVCEQQHRFDMAKEGYTNLLLVQQKKSKVPGDNDEMVKARREFLQAGYYQPLADAACTLLKALNANVLVDIGCGEGYYTEGFSRICPNVIGLDIAKTAVQLAAKKYKHITWLVASGALLPVKNQSVEVVSSLFSPIPVAEMARVLKSNGHILIVRPADNHLHHMREALFGEVFAHQPDKFLAELEPTFSLITQQELRFDLELPQIALKQLLAMTPYVWKAKPERRLALEQQSHFKTQAAFRLMLLSKKHD